MGADGQHHGEGLRAGDQGFGVEDRDGKPPRTSTISVSRGCEIKSSCRGLTIQLRDEGSVVRDRFQRRHFVSSYQAAPWWGRGEAISFTAIPRTKGGKVGTIHDVRVRNVSGRAENSIRINGTPESRIANVTLEKVAVTFDRWTKYPGDVFDNRPTTAYPDVEPHHTPGNQRALCRRSYADRLQCRVGR